ncbi:MAG: serine/threonine protein kinase, partial [Myxococcales bacterium]|nr:serine/threonine protein kinase [Myxococcales bacterium]
MTATVVTVDEDARRRFEAAWKQGPPRIEDFLPPEGDPRRAPTLLELVAIDLELSWRVGKGTTVDDYLARFPALRVPEAVRELAREEERAKLAAATALKPGATVGRYRLIEVHARGGFGVVWRAEDPGLGREVALKTMARPRDAEGRQRFVAEARVASRLEHPGVVPVHELAEGETPWYSMKLVRGKTMAELMRAFGGSRGDERGVAWHHLLEVYLAVARAVAFAHAQGHMHRDVKPDNIIVGDYGETVLLDWGLARPIEGPAEEEGTVLGTPGYMPPEQATGQVAEQDARSDVYALGELLGELLQLERGSPRPLRAIARKATEPEKEARYADAGALAADVERHLANERVGAHREAWWEKLARSIRRHRTAWAVGTATVVMAAIGTTAALVIRRDAQLRHRAGVYAEAVRDETRARAAIAAGRPGDALSVLDEALGDLADEPGQDEVRARLETMRARARRLDTLAAAKEQAWFLSGEERDAAALAEVERAVGAAGPRCAEVDAELPPDRLDECRRGVHGLMLLGAVLHAKGALSRPFQAPAS